MAVTIVGNNTPTAGGVVYGDGTNYASTAAGTSGQPIVSGGSGAPTFRPYTLPAADGSPNQVLQTNGAGALSFATVSAGFTLATPVSTASGGTAEFTGLPSTATVILINLKSVSVDANNTFLLQLGTASAYVTSGYSGNYVEIGSASAGAANYSAAGFFLRFNISAATTMAGTIQLTKESTSNNTWICSGAFGADNAVNGYRLVSGAVSLSGVLTRLKVFDGGSGGLFDGGEINIAYI